MEPSRAKPRASRPGAFRLGRAPFRRRGLAPLLLEAACAYAAESGAAALEAYPWPGGSSYRFMGTRGMYLAAGFQDVPVPSGRRPVMRRPCDGSGIPAWSVTGL